MTRLTLALILIASTAHATTPRTVDDGTGTGGHIPNPDCTAATCDGSPFLPPEPSQPKGDTYRDPQPATTQQHYGFCCRVDGVVRYHTAFGRDDATARAQCTARAVKPACPADLARMIKQAVGE